MLKSSYQIDPETNVTEFAMRRGAHHVPALVFTKR